MALIAREYPDGRRAGHAEFFDVPSAFFEQRVAGCCEASNMRHLAPADECETRLRGQTENVLQPAPRYLLDPCRSRRGRRKDGVLIPRDSQPVGGQRGRQSASYYPREK